MLLKKKGNSCFSRMLQPNLVVDKPKPIQIFALTLIAKVPLCGGKNLIPMPEASFSHRLKTTDNFINRTSTNLTNAMWTPFDYRYCSNALSMAASKRESSAVTSGAKRATTSPWRLIRNFSKFHNTSWRLTGSTP